MNTIRFSELKTADADNKSISLEEIISNINNNISYVSKDANGFFIELTLREVDIMCEEVNLSSYMKEIIKLHVRGFSDFEIARLFSIFGLESTAEKVRKRRFDATKKIRSAFPSDRAGLITVLEETFGSDGIDHIMDTFRR